MYVSRQLSNISFFFFVLDRPVIYLYNTLHYYEMKVRERPSLKRRLVLAVLGSLQDNKSGQGAVQENKVGQGPIQDSKSGQGSADDSKSPNFGLSKQYQKYMQGTSDKWTPELDYYMRLIQRICDSILLIVLSWEPVPLFEHSGLMWILWFDLSVCLVISSLTEM